MSGFTHRLFFAFAFVAFALTAAQTQKAFALDVPPLTGPVVDQAQLMTAQDRASAEQLIRALNSQGAVQLQVLTIPTLNGESLEGYSIKVTDQWKLGTAKNDNGVLLLVALAEKQIRIEVGQGLEGILPDAVTKRIIADRMRPAFREAGPSEGILVGLASIVQTIDPDLGRTLARQPTTHERHKPSPGSYLLFFLLFFVFISMFSGRGGSGGLILASILLSGRGGRGGFGGGGFGSGGGWSGGGGGFSGGGASGGW